MRSTVRLRLVLALTFGVAAPSVLVASLGMATARTFHGTGVIASFADGPRRVLLRHEAIAGYMGAMTMPFEIPADVHVDGFHPGDRVDFVFRAEDDGRRVLVSIVSHPAQ